jgi:hypothetical protein
MAVEARHRSAQGGGTSCLICRRGGGILLQVVLDRQVHVLDCLPRWVAASPAERTRLRVGGRRWARTAAGLASLRHDLAAA